MPIDTDVARVAAALRAPGLRYRSFGNDAVRPAVEAVTPREPAADVRAPKPPIAEPEGEASEAIAAEVRMLEARVAALKAAEARAAETRAAEALAAEMRAAETAAADAMAMEVRAAEARLAAAQAEATKAAEALARQIRPRAQPAPQPPPQPAPPPELPPEVPVDQASAMLDAAMKMLERMQVATVPQAAAVVVAPPPSLVPAPSPVVRAPTAMSLLASLSGGAAPAPLVAPPLSRLAPMDLPPPLPSPPAAAHGQAPQADRAAYGGFSLLNALRDVPEPPRIVQTSMAVPPGPVLAPAPPPLPGWANPLPTRPARIEPVAAVVEPLHSMLSRLGRPTRLSLDAAGAFAAAKSSAPEQ